MTDPAIAPRSAHGARWLFIAYACLLIVLTHWPRLEIPSGNIPRPDLFAHIGAFAIWTYLCARSCWFGARFGPRNLLLIALVAIVYAAFDEGTQAIPWVHRDAGWDDYSADMLGIGVGLALTTLLAAIEDQRSDSPHGGP